MSESQRVTELRREIREMEANKACLDPALYDVMHKSLLNDLTDPGAALEEPPPSPRPVPRVVATASTRTPLHVEKAALAAPTAPEPPMLSTPEPGRTKRPYHRKKPLPPREERVQARRKVVPELHVEKPARDKPLDSGGEAGPAPERSAAPISTPGEIRYRLRGVRRQVWMLMADLESLTAAQLKEMAPELEVLADATHQAHQLSLRREVVG